jgi:hypothetical protein
MSSPALAIFSPSKKMLRRILAFARCPQMIPGIEPSGMNTEQIKDATASAEKRPGACFWPMAAAGNDDADRDAACGIGAGGGGAAAAAAGIVMVFWQVGQAI